jgi:hypothetical protein
VLGTEIDWSVAAKRARAWRADDALYRVLGLTNALVDLGIPARHLRNWERRAS